MPSRRLLSPPPNAPPPEAKQLSVHRRLQDASYRQLVALALVYRLDCSQSRGSPRWFARGEFEMTVGAAYPQAEFLAPGMGRSEACFAERLYPPDWRLAVQEDGWQRQKNTNTVEAGMARKMTWSVWKTAGRSSDDLNLTNPAPGAVRCERLREMGAVIPGRKRQHRSDGFSVCPPLNSL
jgi:hypothetical protein